MPTLKAESQLSNSLVYMINKVKVFSIGFTKATAETFFNLLVEQGVRTVIDVRLSNLSQLSGFAKKKDLEYFLNVITNIKYVHMPDLAPTKEMLDGYGRNVKNWQKYEAQFNRLIESRRIEALLSPAQLDHACLLCSEHLPQYCHRRLVLDYLNRKYDNLEVRHL